MLDCCRPLGVEVYRITDPAVLEGWNAPTPSEYKGLHGFALPTFKKQENKSCSSCISTRFTEVSGFWRSPKKHCRRHSLFAVPARS